MTKKRILFFLFFLSGPLSLFSKDLFLIDKIEKVIYPPHGVDFKETVVITKSEIGMPSLDGTVKTRDDIILEWLIYLDGKKYNIVDEKMVDSYISALQRQHDMTLDDIKRMFAEAGLTYEEGREQLLKVYTVNSMLDFKVRSQLIVPEKEAREYYDNNPLHEEEQYQLQRIFVPKNSKKIDKKRIKQQVTIGQKIAGAEYSDPFWVQEPDLAEEKQFIKKMEVGQVSALQEFDDGYELFKLIDKKEKRLVPFEDRYNEIADTLRRPLYEKLFEEYKKKLYDEYGVER